MNKVFNKFNIVTCTLLISLSFSSSALAQQTLDDGYIGVGVYRYAGSSEPLVIANVRVGEKFSLEGSATTAFDYILRANAFYHVTPAIKLGLGVIDYKSGDFSETGTRLSAGYQLVGTDQWRVNVLAGREFIFDDKNFVEVQVRYEFTDRFSVFYHLQNNSGWMRNEGYLGLGYRF